ncbi:MAG: RNA polymerase sigma-70 factor [Ferruginibacter sp.]
MTAAVQLIQQGIHEGKEKSLAELYHLYNKKLIQFSKAITRSQELAEEAVEDVFVKLWSQRHKILEIENLSVYLYVAIKNTSLNILSRKITSGIHSSFDNMDIEINSNSATPYDILLSAEMMLQLQQAIESLPSRCKTVFKLVREDGLRYKEVAAIMNISVNTIDVHMANAIAKITAILHSAGVQSSLFKRPL